MERVVNKKMSSKVMKIVTLSKKRIESAKEEVEDYHYYDYVADKGLLELILKN